MQLVFHAGPLGEFMLLMPLLRDMDRPITVVAPWQRASLASHMIGAAPMDIEMFEFTRLHAEGGPSRISPAVGELFSTATRIVSFLSAEQDAWADNVKRFAPDAELLRLDPRPDAAFVGHFVDWHRNQLAARRLSLTPIEPKPLTNTQGPIVIHPGGGAMKRCWPADRYEALITALRERGHDVRPVFGEVEAERWTTERAAHWIEQLGAEPFRSSDGLLPLLQQTRLFVGNDAGPLHIAAQLGTLTLGILGPSDPAKSGQRGSHNRTLAAPDGPGRIEDVTLESVIDAVLAALA